MAQSTQSQKQRSPFAAATPALELMCWLVVLLAPALRWVNGAAVTGDQFVVQAGLVCFALFAAMALRIYNWRVRRRRFDSP